MFCLFSDCHPAMLMPICAMPYLLGYARLRNDASLLGDAHPA
jgi:hypothetical protein